MQPSPSNSSQGTERRTRCDVALCATRASLIRRGALPTKPVDNGLAHHELEISPFQPGHLFGEHRHALTVRDRHARDVGSPETALGSESLDDLAQIAVNVLVWVS